MRSEWPILMLAALISGCASWSGPRAAVEDRTVAKKTVAAKDTAKKVTLQKTASRKATEKPQREERQAAKEVKSLKAKNAKVARETPNAHTSVDAMSAHHHIPDVAPPL